METRPATTTFFGDTGLWFVPTAEILPRGLFSVSGYRANFDREPGSTDISHFAPTFAVGIADRMELFGSFRVQTRIDRGNGPDDPLRNPLFADDGRRGVVGEYPLVRDGWQTGVGDFLVGAKVNLASEYRQQPAAFAVRGALKLPTGDDEDGLSTGKVDFLLDGIVSKELNQAVEIAGHVGYEFRGEPDDVETSNAFRYGFGAAFPSRAPLRGFAELRGEVLADDLVTYTASPATGVDGSLIPTTTEQRNPFELTFGAVYQARNGFFAGAGVGFNTNQPEVGTGSKTGWQVRLGYHPGVRIYVPPPPPTPPPTPPSAPENRPPTVKARCEPCTVELGGTSSLTADAQDPDGDTLRYRWSVPSGQLANPNDRQTRFTAPKQEGPVQATVTVDDGKGGTASDTVTIQVVAQPRKEYVFEDVHFDFDRYTLRQEALRVLDEAIKAMQGDTTLRLTIEGHTCNIGTAEYNLALGERRANAVRDYLQQRGVGQDRLRTVSFGEERPKHDNSREETRRMNRRAAMVVRLQ
jgi:outer membrane protein OmpA-like peptidoglycan-associated protein